MDREFLVKIIEDIRIKGKVDINDLGKLLLDYCIDNGKEEDLSKDFIQAMIRKGRMVPLCNIAIDYYKTKFNICEIYEEIGKIFEKRKLLKVY